MTNNTKKANTTIQQAVNTASTTPAKWTDGNKLYAQINLVKSLQDKQKIKPLKTRARRIEKIQAQINEKEKKGIKPQAPEKQASESTVITPDNIINIGERIAVKALKTVIFKSGKGYTTEQAEKEREKGVNIGASGNFDIMYNLYIGLIKDIKTKNAPQCTFSDGYDIASTAQAFLCGYIGKALDDIADNGEKDKDGNPITILRATFRAVNRYIMGERQQAYKRVYVDDIDENGKTLYYEIPQEWDLNNATDYKTITAIIDVLNLSVNEMRFIKYRLRGKSHKDIAHIMGITESTVKTYQYRIREKAKTRPEIAPYIEKLQAK